MKKRFMLYNSATETTGDDRYMTEAERTRENDALRELDSDSRWIPWMEADEYSNW